MSRLYDALAEPELDSEYPKVYRGAATQVVYVQHLRWPFEPHEIGDVREAEALRDALTDFIEGEREQAKGVLK